MEQERKIRVAITQGDTNGVGYEVILKVFADPAMLELCTPIIYGSPKIAAYHRKALNLETSFTIISSAAEAHEGKLNLLTCFDDEIKVELGHPSQEAGQAALKALDRAMTDYRSEQYDVLVTAPINKATIQSPEFKFPGHTEYIETCIGDGKKALMILMNENLRVALVTTHLPIKNVAQAISKETIVEKATIFHQALRRDFRISNPRIAVLALNPHAGDDGLLGSEEKDIIKPAIDELAEKGIQAFGRSLPCRWILRNRCLRPLRRRAGHVSRPRTGPVQDHRLRKRHQLHGRPAHCPYLARPRYSLRHSRTRHSRRKLYATGYLHSHRHLQKPHQLR